MASTSKNYKQDALINFKKASSLLSKIVGMASEDKYCIDIMQQNLAVIGLLKSANQKLMEGHLGSCFKNAVVSGNISKQNEMVGEILQVTKLANK